jgi:hypothetical protein
MHARLPRPGWSAGTAPAVGPAFGQPPLARFPGWTRVEWRVLAADQRPAFELAPVVTEIRAAPGTAPLLREQRVERGDRVDLSTARPTGELWHPGARSDLRQAGQRSLDPFAWVLVVLE